MNKVNLLYSMGGVAAMADFTRQVASPGAPNALTPVTFFPSPTRKETFTFRQRAIPPPHPPKKVCLLRLSPCQQQQQHWLRGGWTPRSLVRFYNPQPKFASLLKKVYLYTDPRRKEERGRPFSILFYPSWLKASPNFCLFSGPSKSYQPALKGGNEKRGG